MIEKADTVSLLRKGVAASAAALLSVSLLAGCAASQPSASQADTESATPSGTTAKPDVAQSSTANEATDGVSAVDVTEELENLKTAQDVESYVGKLQSETDQLAGAYDHGNAADVVKANDLLATLADFNLYLPVLLEDNVITTEEEDQYSAAVDQMILTVDALVAS